MANKLYNQKTIQKGAAFAIDQSFNQYTYKGFSTVGRNKHYKVYDTALVKQDLINQFHIRKGEKLENPNYGTIIWDVLFEPMTQQLKDLISADVSTIINSDPRVAVNSLTVDATDQGIGISIEVTYLPFNVTDSMALTFNKQNFSVG
jgi:phage baseplate assembly protein W